MPGIAQFRRTSPLGVGILFAFGALLVLPGRGWSIAKVYLTDGETRAGTVMVRDGRVTIVAKDRLFQHPIEAVHRIDHVSGETTLVAKDILLREKPEIFSRNLASISKGCEVRVLDHQDQWTRVEVFAGRSKAEGFIHVDDLSDTVYFADVNPTTVFKAPPPSLLDRFKPQTLADHQAPDSVGSLMDGVNETGFDRFLFDRLWGSSLEDVLKQQEILRQNEEKGDPQGKSDGDDSPPAGEGESGADQPQQ